MSLAACQDLQPIHHHSFFSYMWCYSVYSSTTVNWQCVETSLCTDLKHKCLHFPWGSSKRFFVNPHLIQILPFTHVALILFNLISDRFSSTVSSTSFLHKEYFDSCLLLPLTVPLLLFWTFHALNIWHVTGC